MKNLRSKFLITSFVIALLIAGLLEVSVAAKEKKGKTAPANDPVAQGGALFKKNCNMCHYPDKPDKKIGPGLQDLFKNKELPGTHRETAEGTVREQIENGSKKMPAFGNKLSAEEIESVFAYLKTL